MHATRSLPRDFLTAQTSKSTAWLCSQGPKSWKPFFGNKSLDWSISLRLGIFIDKFFPYLPSGTLFFPLENSPALQRFCVINEPTCGRRKKYCQESRDDQQTQASTVFYQTATIFPAVSVFYLKGSMWKDEESFMRSKGFTSCSFSVWNSRTFQAIKRN